MTLKNICKEIKRMDPNLKEDEDSFKTAVVLLSAVEVGTTNKALIDFTKYPKNFIYQITKNLRKNKVFIGNKIYCDWLNEETGGTTFWCDVLCAQGLLTKVQ